MKVKILKTGKVEEYGTSFAIRMIEQGKAVPAPEEEEASAEGEQTTEAGGK